MESNKKLLQTATLLFLAVIGFSCEKVEEEPWDGTPEITMTAKPSDIEGGYYRYGFFSVLLAGAETATIDWGDGTPVETRALTPNLNDNFVDHCYSDPSVFYTVKIKGPYITKLIVSGTYNLNSLYNNDYITGLDLRRATDLEYLSFHYHPLTTVDLSKNTKLKFLYCRDNQLTSLDLSKNGELQLLWCNDNRLRALDMSKNPQLADLCCQNNQITDLYISNNTELYELRCDNNSLSRLDLSRNPELSSLTCSDNPLTALDLSNNTGLNSLSCVNNQLTALDVSKNTKLQSLRCHNNSLTGLDLSHNTMLRTLVCDNNQLTGLDLSFTNMAILYCRYNALSAGALNAMFETLPQRGGRLYIAGNPGTEACDISIAENKGWYREDYY